MVDNFLEKYKNKYKNINSSPDKLKASPGRQGAKGIPMFWKNRQNSLMFYWSHLITRTIFFSFIFITETY